MLRRNRWEGDAAVDRDSEAIQRASYNLGQSFGFLCRRSFGGIMQQLWGTLLVGLVALSGDLSAQDYYDDDDQYRRGRAEFAYARVTDVRAVYDDAAQNQCWDRPVPVARKPSTDRKPEIVGGVVGGVLAKPSVKGPARFSTTPAGTALGAAIEREVQQRRSYDDGYATPVRYQRYCEEAGRESLIGYEVTYDYDGYVGQVFSERRPGREIRVRLDKDFY